MRRMVIVVLAAAVAAACTGTSTPARPRTASAPVTTQAVRVASTTTATLSTDAVVSSPSVVTTRPSPPTISAHPDPLTTTSAPRSTTSRWGRLAFGSGAPFGSSSVDIVDIDGSGHRILGRGWTPVWSPDGTTLAYLRPDQAESSEEIALVDVATSDVTVIYHAAHIGGVNDISWSPDGQHLAFSAAQGANSGAIGSAAQVQIRTIDRDGTHEHIALSAGENAFPEWSPDGSLIAFTIAPTSGLGRVAVVRPDGTGLYVIPGQTESARAPSWSPDSQRLAWASANTPDVPSHLWTARADGTDIRRLGDADIDNGERGPSWSPDSTHIAYVHRGIATITFDGSDRRDLSPSGGCPPMPACDQSPVWSHDGVSIAFIAFNDHGASALATMAADGSDRLVLTWGAAVAASWQP